MTSRCGTCAPGPTEAHDEGNAGGIDVPTWLKLSIVYRRVRLLASLAINCVQGSIGETVYIAEQIDDRQPIAAANLGSKALSYDVIAHLHSDG